MTHILPRALVSLVLMLPTSLPAVAAGTAPDGPFLCIVEHATGFSFDKQSKLWRQTTFPAGEKYIVKRVKNNTVEGIGNLAVNGGPNAVWGVWEFGVDEFGTAFCEADVDDKGYLWCHGIQSIVNFNLRSHRFLRTYTGTYVSDPSEFPDEHADTPVIEIGKCTAL
jgi:hypothetical protein